MLGKVNAHVFLAQGDVRRDVGCEFASVMVNEMAQAAIVFAAFKKRDAPAVGLCQLRGSDHSLPPVAQLSRWTS